MGGARQSRGAHGVVFRKAIDLDESGNRYGAILNDIVEKLQAAGTDRERCNAVKDIVAKYGAVRNARGARAPHSGQACDASHSVIGRMSVNGPHSLQR